MCQKMGFKKKSKDKKREKWNSLKKILKAKRRKKWDLKKNVNLEKNQKAKNGTFPQSIKNYKIPNRGIIDSNYEIF